MRLLFQAPSGGFGAFVKKPMVKKPAATIASSSPKIVSSTVTTETSTFNLILSNEPKQIEKDVSTSSSTIVVSDPLTNEQLSTLYYQSRYLNNIKSFQTLLEYYPVTHPNSFICNAFLAIIYEVGSENSE